MDKKWWTLLSVCAGTFMLLLDIMIVIVALPDIQRELHASFGDVQWVVDAYALTLASLLLTAGVLADRYGRRLLFSTGLGIFTVGSLLCGVAQDPVMLIVSRCVQGVGGAVMFATSLALLAHSFQGKERGVAFGAWGAITGIAVALGPIVGGVITTGWSWRGIFLVNVPIGIFAIAITLWKVEESKVGANRPDWWGFVLLTAGLIILVYGFIEAGEHSWSTTSVLVALPLGAVLLIAFLIAESRVSHPMFDLSLFRVPTFLGGSLAAICMNGSLFAITLYIVLYLQDLLGYSALHTGLRLLIQSGVMLVAATAAGRLTGHVPIKWLIGPGLLLVGIGLLLMTGIHATSTWTHLIPGLIVGGVGAGLVNPPLASTAVGVVEPRRSGMASGINSTFRQVGIAVSIAVQGSIFAASVERGIRHSLAGHAALAAKTSDIVAAVQRGTVSNAFKGVSPADQATLGHAIATSFTGALNDLLYITAAIALVGAVGSFLLIRNQDFHPAAAGPSEGGGGQEEQAPAPEPAV